MSEPQQATEIHPFFTGLYPDEPDLAAEAAALCRDAGGMPPPDLLTPPHREPTAPPEPRQRRRIDWSQAAILLARGNSIEEAANSLRCPPQAIRRNLRRSRKFRLRIESEHEYCRLTAQLRFGTLGDYAVTQLKQQPDNPRLLQWLGDRIGLGQLSSRQAGGLATRLNTALRPGERLLTPDEEAEHQIGKKELETMLRETREWTEAKNAHERMKFEKTELEKQQRREAESRQTGEFNGR